MKNRSKCRPMEDGVRSVAIMKTLVSEKDTEASEKGEAKNVRLVSLTDTRRVFTNQLMKRLNIEENQKEKKAKKRVDDYFQTTTIHGIREAFSSSDLGTKLFWVLIVITVTVMVTMQTYKMVDYYRMLPTVTSTNIVQPEEGIPFPTVTLCAMSKINMTAVREKYPKMNQTLAEFASTSFVSISSTALYDHGYFTGVLDITAMSPEEEQRMKDVHDALRDGYDAGRENRTIDEFLEDTTFMCQRQFQYCWLENSAVFDCCTGIPYGKTEPIVATRRHLIHSGACYEFDFGNFSQLVPGPVGGFGFVYLYPNEHVLRSAFNSHGGYAVHLYSSAADAMLERKPTKLPVGYHNQVHMQASRTTHVELDFLGRDRCKDPQLTYFDSYSYGNCQVECMVRATMERCNCTGISTVGKIPRNNTCSPLGAMQCYTNMLSSNQVRELAKCRLRNCPEQCKYWTYHQTLSVARAFNPEIEDLQLKYWRLPKSINGTPTANSLIIGEVYFDDIKYTAIEQKAALTLESFVSNIGGAMGLWTGASIISWIHLVYFCITTRGMGLCSRKKPQLVANGDSLVDC